MKTGGLYIAVGVLAVLGGLVWWSEKHPAGPGAASAVSPKILVVDPKQVENIAVNRASGDAISLTRAGDKWQITQPAAMAADPDTVNALLSSISSLSGDRLIDEHPASLNEFGLTSPPLQIEVGVKGGTRYKLQLGSDTPSGSGIYAKLADKSAVYTLPSSLKGSLDKTLSDLRDKRLLTFNQDKLTSVAVTASGSAFEFNRNGQGDWQITRPKPLRADNLLVDDFVRKLKDAKMDTAGAIDDKAMAAEFASATKVGSAVVTDNSGAQTLEIRKSKNTYLAKSSVLDGVFKVTSDLGESLNKGVDDFRNKKLFDFGFNDPSKVEINGTAYQKSGDKWMSGTTQYDPASVQTVIDKLRDLSASSFSDNRGGTPSLTLAVTSGDNHRTEKVTLGHTGDTWEGRREGEPAVYLIDAKNAEELQKNIAAIRKYEPPKDAKKK